MSRLILCYDFIQVSHVFWVSDTQPVALQSFLNGPVLTYCKCKQGACSWMKGNRNYTTTRQQMHIRAINESLNKTNEGERLGGHGQGHLGATNLEILPLPLEVEVNKRWTKKKTGRNKNPIGSKALPKNLKRTPPIPTETLAYWHTSAMESERRKLQQNKNSRCIAFNVCLIT
ncbi:hypothetical protein TNCT_734821 [Trichonephila clavata]|uniref:Uncharacterized protein n=1 Tax=Trichonephila clavata TaxID=2740835 RepID=A0A8X6GJ55_TRICU|nr:hypothetical protein TNCT_734821 [Trichonephila clavata]